MSEPFQYGGQAVIEGVMMRGRHSMAVAVRHPSGEIVVHSEPLDKGRYKSGWAKRPLIRGVLLLADTLVLGMRSLMFSANVALEEEVEAPEPATAATAALPLTVPVTSEAVQRQAKQAAQDAFTGGVMWGTMALSLAVGIGIFFVSPLLLTRLMDPVLASGTLSVLVEGLIRVALLFGYLWLIGRLPDVQRVFAYHGAEHMTINAYEAGEPLSPEHVERYSVAHPRCGTAFLLYVVVLSVFVFALLGRPSLPVRLASRIALVPVVAAVAYEAIRFSARHQERTVVRALLVPGLTLQSLTTRQPDQAQIAVAIASLQKVLEVDGVAVTPVAPVAPATLGPKTAVRAAPPGEPAVRLVQGGTNS